MFKLFAKIGIQPFIAMIFVMIFLAWLAPSIGAEREGVSLSDVAEWGVGLIFFFYGLRLDMASLKNGLINVRLHLLVHFSTFVIFPLLMLGLMKLCGAEQTSGSVYYLWIGAFFLATLPSTVSSSVVMVSIAGGNMPAAIFNASISSLLGVFITPILMSIFLDTGGNSSGLGEVVFKLILQVIVPVCAGVALNPRFGEFARARKSTLRKFDETVILLIIYTSFCESFKKKMFDGFPLELLFVLFAGMVALFFAVYGIVALLCKLMNFDRQDTITALFCGSKKSLVHGSLMSKVLFSNPAVIGVILLPTMLYHAMQLVVVSIIAKREARVSQG